MFCMFCVILSLIFSSTWEILFQTRDAPTLGGPCTCVMSDTGVTHRTMSQKEDGVFVCSNRFWQSLCLWVGRLFQLNIKAHQCVRKKTLLSGRNPRRPCQVVCVMFLSTGLLFLFLCWRFLCRFLKCRDQMPLLDPFVHAGGVWPRRSPLGGASGGTRPRRAKNAQIDRQAKNSTRTLCELPEPTLVCASLSTVTLLVVPFEVLF